MQCVRHSLGKGRCQLFFTTHFCITILFLHQCWLHSCSLLCSCFFMVYIGPIATHVNSLYIRFKHMATYFSYDYHEYLFESFSVRANWICELYLWNYVISFSHCKLKVAICNRVIFIILLLHCSKSIEIAAAHLALLGNLVLACFSSATAQPCVSGSEFLSSRRNDKPSLLFI